MGAMPLGIANLEDLVRVFIFRSFREKKQKIRYFSLLVYFLNVYFRSFSRKNTKRFGLSLMPV
jgi:hypothetical protein